jgi:small-conductance mechanosensitive channel
MAWQDIVLEQVGLVGVDRLLLSGTVFLATMIFLRIFKFYIVHYLRELSKKTSNDYDDLVITLLGHISWPLCVIFSVWLGIQFTDVPEIGASIVNYLLLIFFIWHAIGAASDSIQFLGDKVSKKRGTNGDGIIGFLTTLCKLLVWVVAGLLIASNLGYDISALLAGLGVGGIAIAFALQNVLTDLFASLSIYMDKPFKVGDYIVVGSDGGTVKKIGVKSTRIKTLKGEELIIPNQVLTSERVHNYKRLRERRVVVKIGVTYNTSSAKMEKIPKMMESIVKKEKIARFDRCHFDNFGDSALGFETVFYIESADYLDYMNAQQRILLSIKKEFEKAKIDMAYPTQTLYLKK